MKKICFLLLLILPFTGSMGQSGSGTNSDTDPLTRLQDLELQSKVSLYFDTLIVENYQKHLAQNLKTSGVKGYRIRIFSNNGHGAKEMQRQAVAKFLSYFPDVPAYYRYEGSYYKVYVGDFRSKRDALKILFQIDHQFPDAFIVEDRIVLAE